MLLKKDDAAQVIRLLHHPFLEKKSICRAWFFRICQCVSKARTESSEVLRSSL